jgi:hypothetical protein
MTVREHITAKLAVLRLTLTEADWSDIGKAVDLNAADTAENLVRAYRVLAVSVLPFYLNRTQAKSVSENGFTLSLDESGLNRFYLWLCGRYGIAPDAVLGGGSVISDISDMW